MFKYVIRCVINFTLCAAVACGAASAFGVEYRLLAGGGDNTVVSYKKLSEDEGKLTLGKYSFTLDLNLVNGLKSKASQYMDSAVAYLPELATKAGDCFRDIAFRLGG